MIGLCPLKIWYSSVPASLGKRDNDFDPEKQAGKMRWIVNKSTMHCPHYPKVEFLQLAVPNYTKSMLYSIRRYNNRRSQRML